MPYLQLKGQIQQFELFGEGKHKRLVAQFADETGSIDLIWFHGIKYITGKYKLHQEYILFGKPNFFNGKINIIHPDIDNVSDVALSTMGMQPYYHTTEKMKHNLLNSHAIGKMMLTVVKQLQESLPETLSTKMIADYRLMSLTEALHNIHFPQNTDLLKKAQYRLKFEELFYIQLNILKYATDRRQKYRGHIFDTVG
ncbi:ATP-dependent DNA helicase RecG, partial [termite gut metagenome]